MGVVVIESDAQFQAELGKAGATGTVVDFHATWCGPCKAVAPAYSQLAEETGEALCFFKVDVDKCPETAAKVTPTTTTTTTTTTTRSYNNVVVLLLTLMLTLDAHL